jgi:hypothetical protein
LGGWGGVRDTHYVFRSVGSSYAAVFFSKFFLKKKTNFPCFFYQFSLYFMQVFCFLFFFFGIFVHVLELLERFWVSNFFSLFFKLMILQI